MRALKALGSGSGTPWRWLTGSACNAMDVFGPCDSLYRVGVWGRDGTAVQPDPRLADDGKRMYCDGRFV